MTSQTETKSTAGIRRRDLMGGAAAAGSLALLGPSLFARAAVAQSLSAGRPLSAAHWGVFRGIVENGKLVKTVAWEKDRAPNAMVDHMAELLYAPTRIRYPMVRAGYLKDGIKSDRSERGKGNFVRVSWDTALDLVANELKRVKQQYGPASIYIPVADWRYSGKAHPAGFGMLRLMNLFGGYTGYSGDYSTGAGAVIMPHVTGSIEVSTQMTAWPVLLEHSDIIVLWGCNVLVNQRMDWFAPDHEVFGYFEQLKNSKKKVVVIDPRRTESADYFNAEWIAPRPNTDVAMMLGMAHTLVTEKLHDQDFLDTYTTGFEQFLPYLLGQSDGTPKTAEWAAAISGVDAGVIKDLARRFARNRTMLMGGWALQRAHHGEQTHWMIATLAFMLGQVGLPGGGFGLTYHFGGSGAPSADGAALGTVSTGDEPKDLPQAVPIARITDMLNNPGATYDFNGSQQVYPDVRMIYWSGGNPFHHHQDRNRLIKAWQTKPETIVYQDPFWNATARFADIVLPACTFMERDDIEDVGMFTSHYVVPMKKLVEPLFEARNDMDIYTALAKRLGLEAAFTEGQDDMGRIRSCYEVAQRVAQAKKIDMPGFDEFWKKQEPVEFKVTEAGNSYVRYADFRADPLLNPLGTPSGKFEIYSTTIEKMGYDDCGPHPTWYEPAEWLGSDKAKAHPLHLICVHPTDRLHSQLNNVASLRARYTVKEREPLFISPTDAKARGIADGDLVRVFNDRGQMLAGAVVTDTLRPGVLQLREGGWYDPVEPGKIGTLCKYGSDNQVTLDIPSSKLAQATVAHTTLVQVEKYDGPALPITVFDPPASAQNT